MVARIIYFGLLLWAYALVHIPLYSQSTNNSALNSLEQEVPESVVDAYLKITSLSPLSTNGDWELLFGFIEQDNNQHLIASDWSKLESLARSNKQRTFQLQLMRWQYESSLFRFNFDQAGKILNQMAAVASSEQHQEYHKWALSRISLLFWIQGESSRARAFISMADEVGTESEAWFQVYKSHLEQSQGAYFYLNDLINKGSDIMELEVLSVPAGEWLTLSSLLKRNQSLDKVENSTIEQLQMSTVVRLTPRQNLRELRPYLWHLSERQSWPIQPNFKSGLNESYWNEVLAWNQQFAFKKAAWDTFIERKQSELAEQKKEIQWFEWIDWQDRDTQIAFGAVALLLFLLIVRLLFKWISKLGQAQSAESDESTVDRTVDTKESMEVPSMDEPAKQVEERQENQSLADSYKQEEVLEKQVNRDQESKSEESAVDETEKSSTKEDETQSLEEEHSEQEHSDEEPQAADLDLKQERVSFSELSEDHTTDLEPQETSEKPDEQSQLMDKPATESVSQIQLPGSKQPLEDTQVEGAIDVDVPFKFSDLPPEDTAAEKEEKQTPKYEATSKQVQENILEKKNLPRFSTVAEDLKSATAPVSLDEDRQEQEEQLHLQKFLETLAEAKETEDFEGVWILIERYVDKQSPGWVDWLRQHDAQVGEKDIRYLSMMHIGIEDTDIAELAGIKNSSLRSAKSRIRKKADIAAEVEPVDYFNEAWQMHNNAED